jgi:hypothetical protein
MARRKKTDLRTAALVFEMNEAQGRTDRDIAAQLEFRQALFTGLSMVLTVGLRSPRAKYSSDIVSN